MLTVYFGKDAIEVRKKAFDRVREIEMGGTSVERITAEGFERGMLANCAGASSLFSGPQALLLDTPTEDPEVFEEVLQSVAALTESRNTFLIIEGPLLAEQKKIFAQAGATCIEVQENEKKEFNVFLVSDALASRDKRTLWLLLQAARREGVSAENIIGTLFWQLKILRLAAVTKTAEEAEQKAYPYNKAKRALGKFTKGELETLSESVLTLYHDGHRGLRDIDIALERWVLEL